MDKMEVLKVIAHLVITLFLIGCYVFLYAFKGISDPVLQTAIGASIGFWFGSLGFVGGNNKKQPPTTGGEQ